MRTEGLNEKLELVSERLVEIETGLTGKMMEKEKATRGQHDRVVEMYKELDEKLFSMKSEVAKKEAFQRKEFSEMIERSLQSQKSKLNSESESLVKLVKQQ